MHSIIVIPMYYCVVVQQLFRHDSVLCYPRLWFIILLHASLLMPKRSSLPPPIPPHATAVDNGDPVVGSRQSGWWWWWWSTILRDTSDWRVLLWVWLYFQITYYSWAWHPAFSGESTTTGAYGLLQVSLYSSYRYVTIYYQMLTAFLLCCYFSFAGATITHNTMHCKVPNPLSVCHHHSGSLVFRFSLMTH